MSLKFRHQILLAASRVVVLAFALTTFYNDCLQPTTIRQNLDSSVAQAGELTASSSQNWLGGRILALENLAQDVSFQRVTRGLSGLVSQSTRVSTFQFTHVGASDGTFTQRSRSGDSSNWSPASRSERHQSRA